MQNDDDVRIRLAVPGDIGALADIERAAATIFAQVGLGWIGGEGTLPARDIKRWLGEGTLWVAADASELLVGFLAAHELDGALFVAELSVVPGAQKRGIGRRLLQAACEHGRAQNYSAMTLTTYRDIAWNGPFYARFGFVETQPEDAFPAHAHKLRLEASHGHDLARRCMMIMALR